MNIIPVLAKKNRVQVNSICPFTFWCPLVSIITGSEASGDLREDQAPTSIPLSRARITGIGVRGNLDFCATNMV
jgi:hypothetical protein